MWKESNASIFRTLGRPRRTRWRISPPKNEAYELSASGQCGWKSARNDKITELNHRATSFKIVWGPCAILNSRCTRGIIRWLSCVIHGLSSFKLGPSLRQFEVFDRDGWPMWVQEQSAEIWQPTQSRQIISCSFETLEQESRGGSEMENGRCRPEWKSAGQCQQRVRRESEAKPEESCEFRETGRDCEDDAWIWWIEKCNWSCQKMNAIQSPLRSAYKS